MSSIADVRHSLVKSDVSHLKRLGIEAIYACCAQHSAISRGTPERKALHLLKVRWCMCLWISRSDLQEAHKEICEHTRNSTTLGILYIYVYSANRICINMYFHISPITAFNISGTMVAASPPKNQPFSRRCKLPVP